MKKKLRVGNKVQKRGGKFENKKHGLRNLDKNFEALKQDVRNLKRFKVLKCGLRGKKRGLGNLKKFQSFELWREKLGNNLITRNKM
jgi:hypothetical protein